MVRKCHSVFPAPLRSVKPRIKVNAVGYRKNMLNARIKGISQHSSNNHIIAANGDIEMKVWSIRRGDHVRLKGYLVNLDGNGDGGKTYHWHSSTTRNDTGNHSCEVFYVTEVNWLD